MVHYPDDPDIAIKTVTDVERGDASTLSTIEMGSHTGTHIDAPIHVIPGGAGADVVPLDNVIGPARVIGIENTRAITAGELREHHIGQAERLLFKTLNSQRCWNRPTFVSDFVSIAEDAATHLAELKTLAIGIDYLSAGGPDVHRILLGAGVVVIEGLNLSGVAPGTYDLLCLPLKIAGGAGAPARVLLRSATSSVMPRTAQDVFNAHRLQKYEPVLRGVHGTYLFDIDEVGRWFVAVDDGSVHIEEANRRADCTIRCEERDFVEIVEGRRNLITSYMQGRVKVHGDMALAQKFHGLVSAMIDEKRGGA
jgi:arylformamidase